MKSDIISKLSNKGFRMTQARQTIVNLLDNSDHPMTARSIHKTLIKIGSKVNITTVYRELDFLLSQNIIIKVPLLDNELHYEINSGEHHHHLLCQSCGQIQNLVLNSEKKLLEEAHSFSGFEIKRHSLAFFGTCQNCN